jgi:hypothetical protein
MKHPAYLVKSALSHYPPPDSPCGNRKAYEGARAPRGWVAGSSTSRESLGERFVCPAPVPLPLESRSQELEAELSLLTSNS